jgi:hypothetical protein
VIYASIREFNEAPHGATYMGVDVNERLVGAVQRFGLSVPSVAILARFVPLVGSLERGVVVGGGRES